MDDALQLQPSSRSPGETPALSIPFPLKFRLCGSFLGSSTPAVTPFPGPVPQDGLCQFPQGLGVASHNVQPFGSGSYPKAQRGKTGIGMGVMATDIPRNPFHGIGSSCCARTSFPSSFWIQSCRVQTSGGGRPTCHCSMVGFGVILGVGSWLGGCESHRERPWKRCHLFSLQHISPAWGPLGWGAENRAGSNPRDLDFPGWMGEECGHRAMWI